MSQNNQRSRDDFSEPSTSSGYHRPSHRKTPYSRSSTSEKSEKLLREKVLTQEFSHESTSRASTSAAYSKHDTAIKVEDTNKDIKIEEGIQAETKSRGRRPLETIFVTRPNKLVNKKGTSGQKVMLQTNYFKLLTVPKWCLYMYHVDFEPAEDRTPIRKGLLKLHKEKIGSYIYDGTILYTTVCMQQRLELVSVRKSDEMQIKMSIRLVQEMQKDDPHYIQFFNIIVRKCLEYMKMQLVGRNYYDAKSKVLLREFKLELWPGYEMSIRQYEYDFLMCSGVSHKILRQDTVLHMLLDCITYDRHNFKRNFCNVIIGTTVLTNYNNNVYRIEDVDFDATPTSTFSKKTGEVISYQDYYFIRYKLQIKNLTQPMLVTRTKPKERNGSQGQLVYLVPEFCQATGLTDQMRENFHVMRALATHTRVNPSSRIEKLKSLNNRLRRTPEVAQELENWNMHLDQNLLEISGRVLPSEKLIFGNNVIINSMNGEWSRNMQAAPLFCSTSLTNWIIICNKQEGRNLEVFLNKLIQVSRAISFYIDRPRVEYIREDSINTYIQTLEELLSKHAPRLILCVVSNNRADRYTAIKKKCCIDRPVPSQVILQKSLSSKISMSIATKVAIQINCKLGGAPWTIENPLKGLMIIGFDTYHDVNTKGKDYVTMVATVDQTLTQYTSSVKLYHNNEELADHIYSGITKAVQGYRKINKALPMYLLIYRDGVSEGQIPQIYKYEIEHLKQKLGELYYGPNFKMLYIIVSKKINTKFFQYGRNPPTGTIVDDVVTSPYKYDFFIVSQHIRQGTVTPTMYNVISDNSGLDPETVQKVTYKLTHMYYNCSTTVRVPAPCHYAQKLSVLVGRFLHRPPDTQLEDRLYFL